ncbi:glycosyltransferase family 9 protein [Anaerorudis cellulosivorans]|uniref:glycosyltransferase family 9 protein n=1 Tax=Anaerorudis cellulosivorans TaxID=3397862 RepID=UPI00221EF446|nr:glycosyltransferase family 9 protein [Seramator thermalis]MCW1734086.1 glycosyltransferase family 9 protein [Seramator thermalis]
MANVLVIRLSAFGDVALLVPPLYSVAKAYPDDTFYVLTNKNFIALFDLGLPNIQPIGINLADYKGIKGLFRLGNLLRKYNIDKVADVHDVLRSKFLRAYFSLLGKKTTHIDKGRKEKKAIISKKAPLQPLKHTINRYRDVFDAMGYPAEMTFSNYFSDGSPEVSLPEHIFFDKTKKNIGIAPFAKHKAKMYPPEKMEEVIKKISSFPDVVIYLFGSQREAEIMKKWQETYPHVVSVAGKLNLLQELYLMSQLRVMLSMDSANMHLASLVGVPVISIWGATHPYLGFYGFNQSIENAIQIDLDCRPCSVFGNTACRRGDYACLNSIHPSIIVRRLQKYLG